MPGNDDQRHNAQYPKKLRPRRRSGRSLLVIQRTLLAVADAVDGAGPVVGDEDRTILVLDDVVRTAEIALVALDPAGREHFLLGILAVRIGRDADDAATLVLVTVPGAVLGDQHRVLVLGREHASGIELHAERSHMGAELVGRRRKLRALVTHCEFRIRQIALVAIGIAEMLAHLVDHVELVGGQVVADPVAGVFREPVLAGARIDVAADRVANAKRIDFRVAGLGIDAADLRDAGRRNADIEGRSKRNVEPAILVDRDIFPAMRGVGRHVVIHHLAFAELVEIVLGIVVANELVDGDDVERAVLEGEAGGHVEALEDGLDLFLAVVVLDRIDVAETEGADEQRALVAPGYLPRCEHARSPDLDLETLRQGGLNLRDQLGKLGIRRTGRRPTRRCETLLLLGFVTEEPVIRRMRPEFLGTGFVFFQRPVLVRLLRIGSAHPRNNTYCCERKYRSMEYRFHRVTPSAARRLRALLLNVLRVEPWSG